MTHLDGIKVLHTVEKYVGTGEFNWLACIIAFFIALAILTLIPRLITFGKHAFEWKGTLTEFLMGGVILAGSAFIGYLFGYVLQPTIPQTTYKICIIDENVSMVEFNNTYEILDKEGEIYTVVFKDEVK